MSLFQRFFKQNVRLSFYIRSTRILPLTAVNASPRQERKIATLTWQIIFPWYIPHKEILHPHPLNFCAVRNYGIKTPKKEKGKKKKVEVIAEEMEKMINVEELNEKMNRIIEKLKSDYIKQLNVRTSPGAVDTLTVKFEDKNYPLNEIAQINRKNPHLIVINSSSMPEAIQPILKAIDESGMNLNPQQEGNSVFVTIPMITQEHRKQLSQGAKSLFLKSKDLIRNVQEHYIKKTRLQKEGFSEDFKFNIQQQIKAVADNYVSQAEMMMTAKQQELLDPKKIK